MRVNNLYVWSNAEIGSNLEVKGAMAVTGSVTHSGNLTIGGNLAVTGTSEFSDAVNFTGVNVQFGTGVYLKATGGKLYAGSTGGGSDLDFVAGTLTLTKDFTQNNDLRGGIAISRGVSGGNGANGIGTSISFNLENDAGTSTPAGAIEVSLEDATNGSEDTKINISGKVGGTTTNLLTFTGGKWQFYGGLDQVNITDTYIADKQIVLNVGGGASSGNACGIAVEEDGKIEGYIKTNSSRDKYEILTPKHDTGVGYTIKMKDSENNIEDWYGVEVSYNSNTHPSEEGLVDYKFMTGGALTSFMSITKQGINIQKIINWLAGGTPAMYGVTQITPPNGYVEFELPEVIYDDTTYVRLMNIRVHVSQAFNDSGTDLLDIGISTNAERYVANLDVSTTGWKTLTLTNVPDFLTSKAKIRVTYTGQNGDATQGLAHIYFEYMVPTATIDDDHITPAI